MKNKRNTYPDKAKVYILLHWALMTDVTAVKTLSNNLMVFSNKKEAKKYGKENLIFNWKAVKLTGDN